MGGFAKPPFRTRGRIGISQLRYTHRVAHLECGLMSVRSEPRVPMETIYSVNIRRAALKKEPAGASARQTHCPALQACKPQGATVWGRSKTPYQSKTRVRGRQSGARALGRRSDRRVEVNIATLVERHSRYVMLVKVAKDTESVISGLIKSAQRLPRTLQVRHGIAAKSWHTRA